MKKTVKAKSAPPAGAGKSPPAVQRLDQLSCNAGIQQRARRDDAAADDYAALLRDDPYFDFPPVVAYHDGQGYWLADGFHRTLAYRLPGRADIPVDVRRGGRREALRYALGANAAHWMRRTNEDRRKAVTTALSDEGWGKWADREIARLCAVSPTFVGKVRASLSTVDSDKPPSRGETAPAPASRTYKTRHGTTAKMKVGKIGKNKKPKTSPQPAQKRRDGTQLPQENEDAASRWEQEERAIAERDALFSDPARVRAAMLERLTSFGQFREGKIGDRDAKDLLWERLCGLPWPEFLFLAAHVTGHELPALAFWVKAVRQELGIPGGD